jgi:hypothetical protein
VLSNPALRSPTFSEAELTEAELREAELSWARALDGGEAGEVVVSRPARRLPSWRIVLGLLFALSSLAFPWIGLSLSPSLSAWKLTFTMGAVPLVGHVSYGEFIGACTLTAAVSALRSRGTATNTTRACGWMLVATPLFFFLTTRLIGGEILFRLSTDSLQTQVVDRQILQYHLVPPNNFFSFTPDITTTLLLNGLRIGWLLTTVGGGLMAGRLVTPIRHRRFVVMVMAGLAALVAWGVVTGLLAEAAMSDGIAAAQAGRSAPAEHDFNRALALNSQLRYNSQLTTELGQAQADQGQNSALAWLAKAANPPTTSDGIAQQLLDYTQAASLAPRNPVVQNAFAIALADDMIGSEQPIDPRALSTLGGMAFLSFTYGHFAYEAGDDSTTIRLMQQTIAHTQNSELLSLAYTYLGLSEERLGHLVAFRRDIVNAVNLDTQDVNAIGREVAAGLYTPGPP